MVRNKLAGILVVALALLGTASCSSGSPGNAKAAGGSNKRPALSPLAGGEPALDARIVSTPDPRQVAMPLAAFQLDDAKVRIVSRARIAVGDKCMRAFGFSPVPGWNPEGAAPGEDWSRWGLWDEQRAADYGYLPPEIGNGNATPVRFLSRDATNVYMGLVKDYHGQKVPDGGCSAEEFHAVMGNGPPGEIDGHFAGDLDSEARARAAQDSRVVKLTADWRRCVKDAGWDFADPQAPMAYWSTRRTGDKTHVVVSDEEKKSALADIHCKKSTGLLGTWIAADVAYQNGLVERDGDKLRTYQQQADEVVARANKILATG